MGPRQGRQFNFGAGSILQTASRNFCAGTRIDDDELSVDPAYWHAVSEDGDASNVI